MSRAQALRSTPINPKKKVIHSNFSRCYDREASRYDSWPTQRPLRSFRWPPATQVTETTWSTAYVSAHFLLLQFNNADPIPVHSLAAYAHFPCLLVWGLQVGHPQGDNCGLYLYLCLRRSNPSRQDSTNVCASIAVCVWTTYSNGSRNCTDLTISSPALMKIINVANSHCVSLNYKRFADLLRSYSFFLNNCAVSGHNINFELEAFAPSSLHARTSRLYFSLIT